MLSFKAVSKRNITFILFSLAVITLCLSLGGWQLARAEQKQALLKTPETSLMSLHDVAKSDLHQKVSLTGTFDNEHPILLDNQLNNGHVGFNLYLPFISDKQAILVNLGWLPAASSRTKLPAFPPFTGQFKLRGTLSAEQGSPFLLGRNISKESGWPLMVQRTIIPELQAHLNYPIKPLLLQLDSDSNIGFRKNWKISVMPPEKHTAYAIQWFTLALAICICSFYWLKHASFSAAEAKHNKE
jgi:surfeit locus 1 family protein